MLEGRGKKQGMISAGLSKGWGAAFHWGTQGNSSSAVIVILMKPIVIFTSIFSSTSYSSGSPLASVRYGITFTSIMLGISATLSLVPVQEERYKETTKNSTHPEARP